MLELERKFVLHLNQKEYDSVRKLRWVVGLSGGVDSLALLHLLQQNFPKQSISAIHINHKISPNSDDWQELCLEYCAKWSIPLKTIELTEFNTKSESNVSFESKARELRYQKFLAYLKPNDCLFTAHHQDDQVETFLFRLFRGSSSKGLMGINEHSFILQSKIPLKRPLVALANKEELIEFAKFHQLKWAEDESNQNIDIKRNLIRHQLVPLIHQIHPKANQTILKQVSKQKQTHELLTDLAEIDIQNCLVTKMLASYLCFDELAKLTKARLQNLIYQFALTHWNYYFEDTKQLEGFIDTFILNPKKSAEYQFGELRLVHNSNCLVALRNNQIIHEPKLKTKIINRLNIKPEQGFLTYQKVDQYEWGLAVENLKYLEIIDRPNSSRIKLAKKKHSQSLKKLFQEYNIPFYLRHQYPYLGVNGSLTVLPNIGICDEMVFKQQLKKNKIEAVKIFWCYL